MQNPTPLGIIEHPNSPRPTDYLFRISIKCLIRNKEGKVLVAKEDGRGYWDLPGGGMDHGEPIKAAIARELYEEVKLMGDFTYQILAVEDPAYLEIHNFYQLRLIVALSPEHMSFSPGADADEVAFIDPLDLKDSTHSVEQQAYSYMQL